MPEQEKGIRSEEIIQICSIQRWGGRKTLEKGQENGRSGEKRKEGVWTFGERIEGGERGEGGGETGRGE